MTTIDRRIQKTRNLIYQAFLKLLNQKGYDKTSVQNIIDLANVGRSTFYSHYDSKEALLDQLCQDLFHHLFEEENDISPQRYLTHLFLQFRKNQDRIASLLLSHNETFIRKLTSELEHDLYPMIKKDFIKEVHGIPESYLQNYVTSNFIDTVTWWLSQRNPCSEDELTRYYLQVIALTK